MGFNCNFSPFWTPHISEAISSMVLRIEIPAYPIRYYVDTKFHPNLIFGILGSPLKIHLIASKCKYFSRVPLGELELNLLTHACRHLNKHIGEEISW